MIERPAFIQGIFSYEGFGLDKPGSFGPPVTYVAPSDRRAQTIYFRAGNPSDELICLILTRGGKPMRYFPVGAKAAIHVPLAVVEDISPGSSLEVLVAAPAGIKSTVVLDVGFLEIA
jgi:hypothetical protein